MDKLNKLIEDLTAVIVRIEEALSPIRVAAKIAIPDGILAWRRVSDKGWKLCVQQRSQGDRWDPLHTSSLATRIEAVHRLDDLLAAIEQEQHLLEIRLQRAIVIALEFAEDMEKEAGGTDG